jgi:hypothetical protein
MRSVDQDPHCDRTSAAQCGNGTRGADVMHFDDDGLIVRHLVTAPKPN